MTDKSGYTQRHRGFFGGEVEEHFDPDGRKIGETRFSRDWLGRIKQEHYDSEGHKTGETKRGTDWLGSNRAEHFDDDGRSVGSSRDEKELLDRPVQIHRDRTGEEVGRTRINSGLSESTKEHEGTFFKAAASAGGATGAVGTGLGGAATGALAGGAYYFKVLLGLMLLFLIMKNCFPPPGSIRDPHDVYLDLSRQAQTDVTAGNYKAAIPLLDQAIQIYPGNFELYTQRASAYRELGQNDRALQDYNQALKIYPAYLEAYFHRGIMFLKSGAYPEAIADFNICIERDKTGPTVVYYYSDRGLAYLNWGKNASAIEDFGEVLRLKPNDSFSRGSRGLAYLRSGDYEAAIRDYNDAINLSPNDAWFHVNRGVAYEYVSQYDSAIKDYDEAIRINPNFTEAYTARQHAQARLTYAPISHDAPVTTADSVAATTDGETSNSGENAVSALQQVPIEEAQEAGGTATDPVGDAIPWSGVAVSPDLIFARGTINAGYLILNVRFAPGTFSSSTTLVTVNLDTDQNPRTGQPGVNGQGTMDADQIGSEFIVVMGSSTNGGQAQISRYVGPPPNRFTQIGHAPVTFFDDGMEVTIPLSTLGVDSGGISFKVVCSSRISASGFTNILDVLPNVGLPPVRVAHN